MIPRTYPSTYNASNTTRIVTYELVDVTGLREWVDYIPVKNITEPTSNNMYDQTGAMLIDALGSISGLYKFKDYVPVYFDNSKTQAWSTNANGFIPVTTVEVSGGTDAVSMSLTDNQTAAIYKTVTGLSNNTYNRIYGSMWVSVPPSEGNEMMIGISLIDINFTKCFNYFVANEFGSDVYHEFEVNGDTDREVVRYPASQASGERWLHVLWELDTTEGTAANQMKVYLGDVKRTTSAEMSLVTSSTLSLGTAPYIAVVGCQSSSAFGPIAATAKIRACWIKFATTNLFDFDVEADRRHFIDASKGYVTHSATMGSQTAEIFGAGNLSGWEGSGWSHGNVSNVTAGTITSV